MMLALILIKIDNFGSWVPPRMNLDSYENDRREFSPGEFSWGTGDQ